MRWWCNVSPDIIQPALDHHYISMHLGGPKQVRRSGEGGGLIAEVEAGALSIVPAGAAYEWTTRGPIEFAHLYLAPAELRRIGVEEFDRDGSSICLEDRLGIRDPLLQTLFFEILEETATAKIASRLYVDTLLHALQLRLLRSYADAPAAALRPKHSIPPLRLRRVLEYVEANLARDIRLSDLASVAGTSPFHFSRAFSTAKGMPPYAYLLTRRIDLAKSLLDASGAPMQDVAGQCGFRSAAQFSRMFKRITGCSPLRFRQR